MRPKTTCCRRCKTPIVVKPRGPIPRYCSHTCRQMAYETRRVTDEVRAVIRAEVRAALRQLVDAM